MRGDEGTSEAFGTNEKIVAREAGPVLRYVHILDMEIDRMDHAISSLIEKLGPILNPIASGEAGEPSQEKAQSDLAGSLESKCERIAMLSAILEDVERRVEL